MLKIDTNHFSSAELAEEVLKQLGISVTIPLLVTYLVAVFEAIEDAVRPKEDYWDLQEKFHNLEHDSAYQAQRLRISEETCLQLRHDKEDLHRELAQFRIAQTPIDWKKLCEEHPNNKIAMIKEVRNVLGLGLKDAKDLVDSSVVEDNPTARLDFSNPPSWKYVPTKQ